MKDIFTLRLKAYVSNKNHKIKKTNEKRYYQGLRTTCFVNPIIDLCIDLFGNNLSKRQQRCIEQNKTKISQVISTHFSASEIESQFLNGDLDLDGLITKIEQYLNDEAQNGSFDRCLHHLSFRLARP